MTVDKSSVEVQSAPEYDPLRKQKSAEKTARIPIKIVPIEQVLKKPDWIRVKAASNNSRFAEIKKININLRFESKCIYKISRKR